MGTHGCSFTLVPLLSAQQGQSYAPWRAEGMDGSGLLLTPWFSSRAVAWKIAAVVELRLGAEWNPEQVFPGV